jgi:hypothetical protein
MRFLRRVTWLSLGRVVLRNIEPGRLVLGYWYNYLECRCWVKVVQGSGRYFHPMYDRKTHLWEPRVEVVMSRWVDLGTHRRSLAAVHTW